MIIIKWEYKFASIERAREHCLLSSAPVLNYISLTIISATELIIICPTIVIT